MGTEQRRIEIVGSVSRHNSARDEVDDAAWMLFVAKVNELAERPEFESIRLFVS